MIAFVLTVLNETDAAKGFLSAAQAPLAGCKVSTSAGARGTEVRFSGGPDRQYSVRVNVGGDVVGARNYGLTYLRIHPRDRSAKVKSEAATRKALRDWMKRWPAPEGYVEFKFKYRDTTGDSTIVFDRKIGKYWLQAPFTYAIDTRSGQFSMFSGYKARAISILLRVSDTDAIKSGRALIADQVKKHGAHTVKATVEYLRLNSDGDMALGYSIMFSPTSRASVNRFYAGTRVMIHGATGKLIGNVLPLDFK